MILPALILAILTAPAPAEVSMYSAKYHGRRTASGERFNWKATGDFTAAVKYRKGSKRPSLPFGTRVRLTGPTGKTITVRITDTGSYRTPMQWFDLQPAAFKALGLKISQGRSRNVTWEVVR